MPEDIDDQIESKLKKLRKFNKSQNNGQTDEEINEEVDKRFERIKLVANSNFKMKHAKEKSFDNKTHEDYENVNHQALNVEEKDTFG